MQLSDVTQYPATISKPSHAASAPTRQTKRPADRQDDEVGAIQTRLESVALDQFDQLDQFGQLDPFSVMETATTEMALTQTTFEECQKQLSDKVLALVSDNGALGQQLVVAQSHEREVNRVNAQQVAALEAQIASLQKQVTKLIEDQQEETQRLQKRLKVAEEQTKTVLETAKVTWEQHKMQLDQQNSSLQAQVKSVSGQRDSLQAQANGEPQRQQAAVNGKLVMTKSNLLSQLDMQIKKPHTNLCAEDQRRLNATLDCYKRYTDDLIDKIAAGRA